MGGKSSSSSKTSTTTTQNITNETAQADASGVITGNVLQGEITYTEEFGSNVAGAFGQLIELANTSINLAERAGSTAIDKVSERFENAEQPEISVVRDLIPVMMIVAVGLTAFAFFGRK